MASLWFAQAPVKLLQRSCIELLHISGWVCVYGRACVRECVFVYELTKANICTFLRPNMHAYAHELSVCLPACVRVCVGVRV